MSAPYARSLLLLTIGAVIGAAIAVLPVPAFLLGWAVGAVCAVVALTSPTGARWALWASGEETSNERR